MLDKQLTQTSSASDYAARFNELHARVNVTQETAKSLFTRGLKESVRIAMAAIDPPATLDGLQQKAITVDNNLFKTKLDCGRRSRNPNNQSRSDHQAPLPQTSSEPDAMEIDALFANHKGPLPEAEKARRKKFKLCQYCGSNKHQVDCPKRPANKNKPSGKVTPRS